MCIKKSLMVVLVVMFFTVPSISFAQDYGLGTEGLKAGTAPGPGVYYVMYNSYYTADKTMDKDGGEIDNGFDITAIANVHRFVYFSKKKFLGAWMGFNVIVPFLYKDLKIDAVGVDDTEASLGDISFEPLSLSWHREKWDMGAGISVIAPTGTYDEDHAANTSNDHYTIMLTYGGTSYLDKDKTWALSALGRYEYHFKDQHNNVIYGDDINIEWGISKEIKQYTFGLAGYAHWQITDDDGDDVTWDKSTHDRVFGIGPEVNVFVEPIKSIFKFKIYKEFGAVDRSEGTSAWITFVKIF